MRFARTLLPVLCTSQQFVELLNQREEFNVKHQDRTIRVRPGCVEAGYG